MEYYLDPRSRYAKGSSPQNAEQGGYSAYFGISSRKNGGFGGLGFRDQRLDLGFEASSPTLLRGAQRGARGFRALFNSRKWGLGLGFRARTCLGYAFYSLLLPRILNICIPSSGY